MLYNLISTLLLRVTKVYKREPVDEHSILLIVFGHEKSLKKMVKRKVDCLVCSISSLSIPSCSRTSRGRSRKKRKFKWMSLLSRPRLGQRKCTNSIGLCRFSAESSDNCGPTLTASKRWKSSTSKTTIVNPASPKSPSAKSTWASARKKRKSPQ